MRIARLGTLAIAVTLALGAALPAEAATTTISIVSRTQGFSPSMVSKPEGTTPLALDAASGASAEYTESVAALLQPVRDRQSKPIHFE